MEEPVGEGVVLKADNAGRRTATFGCEHVVPLENLVEGDAVHEAAEADAQHDAWQKRRWASPHAPGVPLCRK
jgi:hypothetical protein